MNRNKNRQSKYKLISHQKPWKPEGSGLEKKKG